MSEKKSVADFLLSRLGEWGVRRIFGYPGDGINGLMGALRREGDEYDFVQVAHEELAGLMATAHSKFTGEVGVCASTGGPGAIHLLNGLYDAKLDHMPVLAFVGQAGMGGLGGDEQQEVNLKTLLEDVSAYVETIATPVQARHVLDRALRTAIGERAVCCIILPNDVQRMDAVENPPHEHGLQHSSSGYVAPRMLPREEELRRAADVLNAGNKVAILAGAGAINASLELEQIADLLGAGVAKALLGKSALPDDLPFVTGSVGWLGTPASNEMMKECDTLFMIGSAFPYTEFLPKEGQARGVQIDIAPRNLGLRFPMEVSLAGDAGETLRSLIPLIEKKSDRSWRSSIEKKIAESRETLRRHAHAPAAPLNPQLVFAEMSDRLPDNAILTADSGSSAIWLARHVQLRRGMKLSLSGGLATMGCSIPYALAGKMAYPDRVAVASVGDGAMQMSGINALIDVAKYWKEWKDPRFVVMVLNNRDLNYVTWEQRVMEGDAKFQGSQNLPDFDYAAYARMLGLNGIHTDSPESIASAWDQAFASDRPTLIDAIVNADVPTLPPEITKEQKSHIDEAIAAGDPDARGIEQQMASQEIKVGAE